METYLFEQNKKKRTNSPFVRFVSMQLVEKNQNVTLSYTLRDWGGEILEQAPHNNPIVYLHGYSQILPALEEALEGHKVGDSLDVRLISDNAFGPYREDLLIVVDRAELAHLPEIKVGHELERHQNSFVASDNSPSAEERGLFESDGSLEELFSKNELEKGEFSEEEPLYYIVREIFEESYLLDGNHYLAGIDLHFELKVLGITPASYDEIEQVFLNFGNDDELDERGF